MIKIIQGPPEKKIRRWRVTCHICHTIFECDQTDTYKKIVGQGIIESNTVHCPTCWHECVSWYGVDKFEEI